MHILEMSKETPRVAVLKNKNIIFFFYKIVEQEGRTGPVWQVGTGERGEEVGKDCRRVNMVQILCTHLCKWKNGPVETIPGMGVGE
jgi:hypothetical protein